MSKINVNTWEPESGTDMTMGASGDTVTVPSGVTLSGFSSIAWQAVQTTGFTAVAGKGYPCNTTAGAFTVTLPASVSVGDQIAIVDYAGTFDTNNLTISPNGLKLKGATDNVLAATERQGVTLTYADVTQGWVATSGVNTGSPALKTTYSADFLVIAGGGGGGTGGIGNGGAAGAGGYRNSFNSEASGGGGSSEAGLTFVTGVVYTVTIGGGGAADANGVDSSLEGSGITTITSVGGGKGGAWSSGTGGSGGSGGGGAQAAGLGGSGTSNQGYNGGTTSGSSNGGSGGGGSSAVGQNCTSALGGNGGDGLASSITGASVTRGGGGGGANHNGAGSQAGLGGSGGGGNGRYSSTSATAGTVNTGGGGGGHGENVGSAGVGGSGVIILRMPTANYSAISAGSPTVSTSGTDTILSFNASGSYTG